MHEVDHAVLEYPMIQETSIFKKWYDEAKAEGWSEAWSESQHAMLLKLLERKFGQLSEKTKTNVQKLSRDDSDSLAVALFDLQTIDDLNEWLAKSKD